MRFLEYMGFVLAVFPHTFFYKKSTDQDARNVLRSMGIAHLCGITESFRAHGAKQPNCIACTQDDFSRE